MKSTGPSFKGGHLEKGRYHEPSRIRSASRSSELPDPVPVPDDRPRFLGQPRTYLNTGAGSLTVDTAAEAAREAQGRLNPMPGTVVAGEAETAALHACVRDLVADFLHAGGGAEISFHQSATAALFGLAFGLRGRARAVVQPRSSPTSTTWPTSRPGRRSGARAGAARSGGRGSRPKARSTSRHLLSLVDARTGLLAVTSASNGTGSVVRLAELVSEVRRKAPDCLVAVDAVHHAPHGPLDVAAAGVDFLVFSGYKVFGPMLGVLWGRRQHLERLLPYRGRNEQARPAGQARDGHAQQRLARRARGGARIPSLAGRPRRRPGPLTSEQAREIPLRHGGHRRIRDGGSRDGSSRVPPPPAGPPAAASASPTRSARPSGCRPSPSTPPGSTATETKSRLWQRGRDPDRRRQPLFGGGLPAPRAGPKASAGPASPTTTTRRPSTASSKPSAASGAREASFRETG
ncbi:MAG: aminotransferase class V-fold PLP-dependent enzyme [Candidatus Moduliflexus flocculans]|nr:aminotransferase class V-fold PLP-dependent enzyme [Candidatus Moduliflexus flocculans]